MNPRGLTRGTGGRGGRGASALRPAKVIRTPLSELASQLMLIRYNQPSEANEAGNKLQNVSYYTDSALSKPIFINCELKNVSFVQCKFRATEFRDLKLTNVAFLYIDCDNVTISGLSLEGHLWKTTIVRNAWLLGPATQSASNKPLKTILEPFKPLKFADQLSRYGTEWSTIIETLRLDSPSTKLAKVLQRFESTFPASLQVPLRPQQDLLVRLVDHKHIVSRVVQSYTGRPDHFSKGPRRLVTIQEVATEDKPRSGRRGTEKVYIYFPESTLSSCLALLTLLHISKTRPTMMSDRLHGPFDHMQCTVSTPERVSSSLTYATVLLHYQIEDCSCPIRTDEGSWHHLMNYIRHNFCHIWEIQLKIGKRFWDLAEWKGEFGVKRVMSQKSLRNDLDESDHPNFLKEIAKIAAPARRKHYDREFGNEYFGDGTYLDIIIENTDSTEKREFLQHIERYIEKCRKGRPLYMGRDKYTVVANDPFVDSEFESD